MKKSETAPVNVNSRKRALTDIIDMRVYMDNELSEIRALFDLNRARAYRAENKLKYPLPPEAVAILARLRQYAAEGRVNDEELRKCLYEAGRLADRIE